MPDPIESVSISDLVDGESLSEAFERVTSELAQHSSLPEDEEGLNKALNLNVDQVFTYIGTGN